MAIKRPKPSPRITEQDFIKANRRAARLEEIAEHGKLVSLRSVKHRSKKAYNRKKQKQQDEEADIN